MFAAPEHLSPRRSIAPGGRDEGKQAMDEGKTRQVRFTLGMLSLEVVFLAACVVLVHEYLSPRRRLPSSSTRQVVVALGDAAIPAAKRVG